MTASSYKKREWSWGLTRACTPIAFGARDRGNFNAFSCCAPRRRVMRNPLDGNLSTPYCSGYTVGTSFDLLAS